MRLFSLAVLFVLPLSGCTLFDKHSVVPTFDPDAVRAGSAICKNDEYVSIGVTDNTPPDPDPRSFMFRKDPALVYQRAFEESLESAGCASGGRAALGIRVNIGELRARALPEPKAHVKMIVTLVDENGRPVVNKTVFVERDDACGAVCTSGDLDQATKEVITESVMQSMAELWDPMKKALASRSKTVAAR